MVRSYLVEVPTIGRSVKHVLRQRIIGPTDDGGHHECQRRVGKAEHGKEVLEELHSKSG